MNKDINASIAEKMRKSPLAFFLRNPQLGVLFLISVLAGGAFAVSSMPVESDPEVKIPIATVTTVYPGASPSDVEKLVTDELEEGIKNLDDVKEITSTSTEGVSSIVVEFEASADLNDSIRSLRDEVDTASADLPDDAKDPIVKQVRAGDDAIVTFLITGDALLPDIKSYADDLEDIIEDIQGVNEVTILGLPDEEMQIFIKKQALEGFELSISDVQNAIQRNHIDVPVGRLRTNNLLYQASIKGQFDDAKELENLVIAERGGRPVYLRDIADVREAFASPDSQTRLYRADTERYERTVSVEVRKKVGADLVKLVSEAKEQVRQYEEESLPEEIDILVINDFSEVIKEDITRLLNSAWQTVLVIAITLLLALGRREALAASFAIPVLYLISLMVLASIGSTFNFLTFFALILSLGIVVDTAIVVIEGIYENRAQHGLDSETAALASIGTFAAPLTSGVMTTVGAFLPLGLMTGLMGEYVKHIPITVNITLMCSLFTALVILPGFAKKIFGTNNNAEIKPAPLHATFDKIKAFYTKIIDQALNHKKVRRLWIGSMAGLFVLSLFMVQFGIVKFKLFSTVDADNFSIEVEIAEGSTLDALKEKTEPIEALVEQIDGLEKFVTIYGIGKTSRARIDVILVDRKDRDLKSFEIVTQLRPELRKFTDAIITVSEQEAGPPSGADIEMRLLGDDMRTLELFSAKVEKVLAETEGAVDVRNDLEIAPGEYHISLKRDRLEYFGVQANAIGGILRTSVFGNDSVKINRGGEETPIVVRMDFRANTCLADNVIRLQEAQEELTICRSYPKDVSQILNMQVPTKQGMVPLSELIDVKIASAVTSIRHFNRERVVRVRANVAEGYILGDVLSTFQEEVAAIDAPKGVRIAFGGENEDTAESMQSLARASVIGILMIIAILTYQFGSFKQMFIILLTMPLAIMGVLYGLAIIRVPLSFPGMIGLTALLGIVVNDAIVLVDKMNSNRVSGIELKEAVRMACMQRMEPVIITTLTTSLGVIPLIFGGETFRDLAIVVSIGITIATVFTLIIVPIFYVLLEEEKPKKQGDGLIKKSIKQIENKVRYAFANKDNKRS